MGDESAKSVAVSEKPKSTIVCALLATLMLGLAVPIVLWDTSADPIANGDEAIYAQMGREMYETGEWEVPRWQGLPILPRPPLSFWVLAAGRALGDSEASVRIPNAILVGLECALIVVLGAQLFSLGAGVLAAALLLVSQLVLRYGRYYESEPTLCVCVLLAFVGYERMRRDRWGVLLFGLGFGGALMTKQVIGLLPLGAIAVDFLLRDPDVPRVAGRRIAAGLALSLALIVPWYARMIARFPDFIAVHFVGNVVKRSQGQLLRETTWRFYFEQLATEKLIGVLFLLGCVVGVIVALRRRSRAALLVSGWGLAVLALFSIARSRYDYYLLLAYPAFALAAAAMIAQWAPIRARLRWVMAFVVVVTGALTNWPAIYGVKFGDRDFRALLREGQKRAPDTTEILVLEQVPYTARYYADSSRRVTMLLRSKVDYDGALWQQMHTGMPTVPEYTPDLPAALQNHGASLLLIPSVLEPLLRSTPLTVLAKTPTYTLFRWR